MVIILLLLLLLKTTTTQTETGGVGLSGRVVVELRKQRISKKDIRVGSKTLKKLRKMREVEEEQLPENNRQTREK